MVARDDAFNSGTLDVTVTVTDQNEGPEISGQRPASPSPRTRPRTGSWPSTPPPTLRTRAAVHNALEPDRAQTQGTSPSTRAAS